MSETSAKFEEPWRLARGTAILSMLWVHGMSWSLPRADYLQTLQDGYRLSYLYLGGLAALALPGIAGRSFSKLADSDLKRHLLFAWLFLLCGFLVNWLTWGAETVGTWDGLYFIAASAVVLGVTRKFGGGRAILPLAIFSLVLSELIRVFFGANDSFWLRPLLGGTNPPVAWPVLPWIGLFLLSFLSDALKLMERFSWKVFLGIFLVSVSYENGFFILYRLDAWTHNPFNMGAGLVLAVWCGLMLTLQGYAALSPRARARLGKLLFPLSDGTFWIYLIHVPVGYRLATEVFAEVPPLLRVFLTPSVLLINAWFLGWFIGWVSRKRFRVVVVKSAK